MLVLPKPVFLLVDGHTRSFRGLPSTDLVCLVSLVGFKFPLPTTRRLIKRGYKTS